MPDLIITRRRLLQCAGGFPATTAVPVTWAKLMDRVLAIETTTNVREPRPLLQRE
jgi:hypothetical protein